MKNGFHEEDKTNPLIPNIQQWKFINLKNDQQITEYLFPSLRQNSVSN